jgi:hypothetical protein
MTIKIKDDKVNSLMFSLFDATGKLIYQFQPSSNSMILPRNKFGNCVGSFILSATDGISSQSQKLLVTGY